MQEYVSKYVKLKYFSFLSESPISTFVRYHYKWFSFNAIDHFLVHIIKRGSHFLENTIKNDQKR